MRIIRETSRFRKSFKKLSMSGDFSEKLKEVLSNVVDAIARGEKLEVKYRDHELTGEFAGHRECHIKPDLLLIYYIENNDLVLVLENSCLKCNHR